AEVVEVIGTVWIADRCGDDLGELVGPARGDQPRQEVEPRGDIAQLLAARPGEPSPYARECRALVASVDQRSDRRELVAVGHRRLRLCLAGATPQSSPLRGSRPAAPLDRRLATL